MNFVKLDVIFKLFCGSNTEKFQIINIQLIGDDKIIILSYVLRDIE